ncbi:MAG: hypothetical protein K2O41_06650, partial [Clostridia bacterium]|nr:hypothetical protein [Clostridia bacterium]
MKLKTKKNLLTVMLSVLCAVLLCCSVGLLSGGNRTATAKAPKAGDIKITEIAPGSGSGTFSGAKLAELYDAILGDDYKYTGTYNKVKADLAANGTAKLGSGVSTKAINATDLRVRNSSKDIYVTFGGIEWEVVYVTTNRSGDVIVDLYQATSTETSQFSSGMGYTDWDETSYTHIGNIYSTSYIRCATLGNGGTYRTYTSAEQANAGGSATAAPGTGTYARFAAGDLSSYLDAPANVDYQEKEGWPELHGQTGPGYNTGNNFVNDAYGIPTVENYFQGGVNSNKTDRNGVNTNYTSRAVNSLDKYGNVVSIPSNHKAGYEDWQNDKVWLPSITETGNTPDGGIWGLSNDQRINIADVGPAELTYTATNNAYSWLRSGHLNTASRVDYLASGDFGNTYSSATLAVRPAIHLNLTKAQESATSRTAGADFTAVNTPTDLEFTYDGKEYTSLAAVITRVEAGKKLTVPDANGDTNSKGVITWYDETDHAIDGNSAGTAASTIYKAGSTLAYKIDYTQGSVDASGNSNSGKTAVTLTEFKIKNAGVYTVTCYFENATTTDYQWRDIKTGAMSSSATTTFKIIVKQLEVKYKWKSSGGKLNETSGDATKQWKVAFDKDTFTPDTTVNPTATSQAPWVYLEYTLLKDNGVTDNVNAELLTYDQTNKKSMLGTDADDTLPCIVVKYDNTEKYDNLIDNIYVNKNGTTRPVNGTTADPKRAFPQEAGNYTVSAEDINAKYSNYILVPDAGEVALSTSTSSATRGYEIEQQEVNAPIKPASPLEYNGDQQSYRVSNYDEDYMEYGTWDGTTSEFTKDAMPKDSSGNDLGMTAGTTGTDAPLTLKATNANNYNIAFRLPSTTVESTSSPYHTKPLVRNYKWKSASATDKDVAGKLVNGSSNVIEVNYAILPKTLEFDFHSSVKNSSGSETFTIKLNDTTGKLTYSYKPSASPVTPSGAASPEAPVLELYYKTADSTGAGSLNPNHTTDPTEFLYKDLKDSTGKHTTGKYIIYVALADPKTNPVNKNYILKDIDAIINEMTAAGASTSDIDSAVKAAQATYEKEITITAGEASLNDLPIVYKEDNNITNSDVPTELSFDYANKGNLQFKLGSDGKTPVPYWIYFDLSTDFSFLEVVGSISYQYDAPATDTSVCTYDPYGVIASGSATGSFPMRYAGTLTITVKIKVKDSEKAENKLPTQADYDALNTPANPNKFTYTAGTPDSTTGNVYDGTLVFTYEIRKAEVDATAIADTTLLQWKYSTEDDTKWKNYTDKSYPEYNEIALVDFRINPSKYNNDANGTIKGVKGASLDSITNAAGQPEKQGPGTRYVTILYTVDENNYEKVNHDTTTLVGKYKYTVEISPKIIDSSDLTLTTWQDASGNDLTNSLGVPYQIWELNLPDSSFANFIDYEYYLYDAATSSVGTLIGKGDTALNDLTDPNGPYAYLNIDAGSSAYIYVKPVINLSKVDKVNGEPKYALKDLSGNTDKDVDGNDGYKKFEFGKQMTVIKVELQKTESEYGTAFTAADIIKITMGGSVAAESTYNTVVYKDKIDKDNIVGDLASFCTNSATLDAGKYIIKVTAVNGD